MHLTYMSYSSRLNVYRPYEDAEGVILVEISRMNI